MSDPTRYSPAGDGVVRTDPKGPLINHYYYEQLKAENATLEAKVKRMAMDSLHDINHIGDLQEENARLKAEVKALRAELADAQESNHILNEIIAMMRKEGKQ